MTIWLEDYMVAYHELSPLIRGSVHVGRFGLQINHGVGSWCRESETISINYQ